MTKQFEITYVVETETKNDAIGGAVLGIFLADQEVPDVVHVRELEIPEEEKKPWPKVRDFIEGEEEH
jgi:hypothetical protein